MTTTLSGTVRVDGSPASGAVVELHNRSGDVVDQVQIDDDASYTYHVTPGRWSLNAWDSHGRRAEAAVDVSEGETKSFDLDLR